VAAGFCFSPVSSAAAQDMASSSSVAVEDPAPSGMAQVVAGPAARKHVGPERDFSVGIFGNLTSTRRTNYSQAGPSGSSNLYEYVVGATATPGAVLSYHQQNSTWSGYKVNLGYTETTFKNSLVYQYQIPFYGTSFSSTSLHTGVLEVSGAYTVESTAKDQRLRMFGEVGGGGLAFIRGHGNTKELDGMVFTGVGVDWRLTDHLGLRAEYRGLITGIPAYQAPNFIRPITLISEPTVSVVYRFGKAKASK